MASSYRQLFTLAWPIVLARSAQAAIGFADAAMIAVLGKDALAATTTGALNTFALFILPMGLVFIVQSFAAQLLGQGDLAGARRYAWYGLLVAGDQPGLASPRSRSSASSSRSPTSPPRSRR
jgi:MATE family multidrug resistance protein